MTVFIFYFFPFAEFWGSRHFVTFMLFLGMANAYVMRTNMYVAIVAMVNHTHIDAGAVEILDDECPDYNTSSSVSVPFARVVFPFVLYYVIILCHMKKKKIIIKLMDRSCCI